MHNKQSPSAACAPANLVEDFRRMIGSCRTISEAERAQMLFLDKHDPSPYYLDLIAQSNAVIALLFGGPVDTRPNA